MKGLTGSKEAIRLLFSLSLLSRIEFPRNRQRMKVKGKKKDKKNERVKKFMNLLFSRNNETYQCRAAALVVVRKLWISGCVKGSKREKNFAGRDHEWQTSTWCSVDWFFYRNSCNYGSENKIFFIASKSDGKADENDGENEGLFLLWFFLQVDHYLLFAFLFL